MERSYRAFGWFAAIGASAFCTVAAAQQEPVLIPGAACETPPILHCPEAGCPADRVINPGLVVEMQSRRTYFLDYPCDLKPDERSRWC